MPNLPAAEDGFRIGKARTIRRGKDLAFIACGETVAPAYEAAQLLSARGVSAELISMHTIKPLDEAALRDAASRCGAIITVEEHSVYGGLGEACASVLLQKNLSVPFRIVALPDEDTVTGSQAEIFDHYGISARGLFETALNVLNA